MYKSVVPKIMKSIFFFCVDRYNIQTAQIMLELQTLHNHLHEYYRNLGATVSIVMNCYWIGWVGDV